MKKQMTLGIAAAAIVVLVGTPAMATAAPKDSTTNPHGQTNGAVINPFTANGGALDTISGKTNGAVINPFKAN